MSLDLSRLPSLTICPLHSCRLWQKNSVQTKTRCSSKSGFLSKNISLQGHYRYVKISLSFSYVPYLSFKNKSQEELLTLLASVYDEWLDLYPCLSLLASIALIVSSVNCKRHFSAMNRVSTQNIPQYISSSNGHFNTLLIIHFICFYPQIITDLRNRLQGEHLAA